MDLKEKNISILTIILIIFLIIESLIIISFTSNTKEEKIIIQEPICITIDKESIKEIEKPIYIEVPIFIEIKQKEEKLQIDKKIIDYKTKLIANSSGFKSYMSYKTITKESSKQYKLQQLSHTGLQGFRIYEGRYIVALGTGTGASVGQYVDIVLQNGTHIPAIMGDVKDDKDTDNANIFCENGCCTEFIIDPDTLTSSVKISGDCSSAYPEWQSPVIAINVLDKKIF